ncbi:hypothetical protein BDR04DRAFT_362385 [Suillus decipiens]|nr:hypothetical protein BDR04DRAFT_362385 [Suillus decipiens]
MGSPASNGSSSVRTWKHPVPRAPYHRRLLFLPMSTTHDLTPPINLHACPMRPNLFPSATSTPTQNPTTKVQITKLRCPRSCRYLIDRSATSPTVTGLTKTYTRSDFSELRQLPSAR